MLCASLSLPFLTADVHRALEYYADVCATVLSTLQPRLLSSLRISLPSTVPESTLLSLIEREELSPSALRLPGATDVPGPAWMRLQGRYVQVRGLQAVIVKMRNDEDISDVGHLEGLEERMRAIGL